MLCRISDAVGFWRSTSPFLLPQGLQKQERAGSANIVTTWGRHGSAHCTAKHILQGSGTGQVAVSILPDAIWGISEPALWGGGLTMRPLMW